MTTHADVCYNITKLELIDPELPEPVDIFDTRSFTMPNHPVTVTAEVTPRKYLLTIRYVVDADPSIIIPNFTQQYEYNYTYEVPSPVLTDYEPVEGYAIVTGEMPCKNKTVVVHYIGKKHNITSECANLQDEYNYTLTTNPADEARFGETVTVTVTPPEHVSVAGLVITDANDNPVAHTPGVYDEENGTFTFTFVMPSSDVNVCPDFTEKYWDDYGPADISWFTRDKDVYELTTDSMLGGLAALVSGREWLYDGVLCDPYFTELEVNGDGTETNRGFDFRGITIIVNSPDGAPIDLIEHKWRPIGAQRQYLKQFNGTFDGQNIEIVNMDTYNMAPLDSDENGSCEAFFGNVGRYGQVLNLNISGSATGRYFTAGVAGTNYGIIANCVANVVVRSEFSAGGIVGNNYGIVVNSYCTSPEVNCMAAAASKDANNYFVGGVASYNNGIISNCHSVALLVKGGTMGNNVTVNFGGLVGVNDGEVSYCYWKVNPIAPALGGGTVEATNCNVLNNGSAAALNSRSQALASEYEALEDLTFNGWKQGAEYPVFDLERGIMSSNEHDINVDIYPNPTKGMVYILSENIQRVSVFNMFGQMVLDTEINSNEATINMSTFSAGVYMVRIATAEGITTKNVVVE